jgi:hypothetical protein
MTVSLIGVTDVPPLVVELRMAPPGYGWMLRSQETCGQWISVPDSTWCDFESVKYQLSLHMPLHLVMWWERGGEYSWSDC